VQARDIAIIIGVVALVILLFALLGGGMMGPGMMGWGGFSPWWGVLMMLFWLLVIAGIVLLVIWLFRQGTPAAAGPGGSSARALDILRERYARGEISRDEYEQMRRDIEGR
jgi:putative membrane protein